MAGINSKIFARALWVYLESQPDGEPLSDEKAKKILFVLRQAKLLKKMPLVFRQLKKIEMLKKNIVEINIISARELSKDAKENISKKIEADLAPKTARIFFEADENIIGGFIVRENGFWIENSSSFKLRKIFN